MESSYIKPPTDPRLIALRKQSEAITRQFENITDESKIIRLLREQQRIKEQERRIERGIINGNN